MTIDEFKKNIAPYMRHGFVFMNENGGWMYCRDKPEIFFDKGYWSDNEQEDWLPFNIELVDNWKESLIEVGK